ncbi:MAG: polysaccharide deacetylase family protein [Caulobacter sp.]|nr:polysaccharide deacetylase family protein [Caulobacter sp.]
MEAYTADRSIRGKLRRRYTRLAFRKPLSLSLDRPMLTFSFDDVPATAALAGARVLEEAGLRGTFYICAGLEDGEGPMGRYGSSEDARRLVAAGHEVACHTFSHLDCGQADLSAIAADVDRNGVALAERGAADPVSFAYPYGDVSFAAKRALGGRFKTLRTVQAGLVTDGSDANQLPAVGIEGDEGEARALHWMEQAVRRKAWLILYTHDVAETPSAWGCNPGALERLARQAREAFEVVTMAQGAAKAGL